MRRKNSWCLVILFFLLTSVSLASAIRINEVELNPAGEDAGNEWIELYIEREENLDGWKLVNNDEGEFFLEGEEDGYYVIIFETQWLDNSDEKVFLHNNEELIDETSILEDSSNSGKTFQYCDGEWLFLDETKGEKNNCPSENEEPVEEEEENKRGEEMEVEDEQETGEKKEQLIEEESEETITSQIIKLNENNIEEKDIKTYKDKTSYIKEYAIYGFAFLLIIIIIILLLKR